MVGPRRWGRERVHGGAMQGAWVAGSGRVVGPRTRTASRGTRPASPGQGRAPRPGASLPRPPGRLFGGWGCLRRQAADWGALVRRRQGRAAHGLAARPPPPPPRGLTGPSRRRGRRAPPVARPLGRPPRFPTEAPTGALAKCAWRVPRAGCQDAFRWRVHLR